MNVTVWARLICLKMTQKRDNNIIYVVLPVHYYSKDALTLDREKIEIYYIESHLYAIKIE